MGCGSETTPPAHKAAPTPESKPAPATRAILIGPYRIEFRDLHKDRLADPPVPGRALVTIFKHDPEAGAVTWSAVHYERDSVGRPRGAATFRHRVFSQLLKRELEIDFNTGISIDEITPQQVVGGNTREGLWTIVVDEVVFTRPDGTWDWLHLMEGPDVRADKPPVAVITWGRRNPAEILYLADQDWKSRNPKIRRRAQESYRVLLKECPDADVVKPARDRIRERSESVIEE